MITKFNEHVAYVNNKINHDSNDFRPFIVYKGHVYLGAIKQEHESLCRELAIELEEDYLNVYHNSKYHGCIWINEKLMSFYNYPETNERLHNICIQIEEMHNIKIWNNEWKIEVFKGLNEFKFNLGIFIPVEWYNEGIHYFNPSDYVEKNQDEEKELANKFFAHQESKIEVYIDDKKEFSVEEGDIILGGKFKNKKIKVKTIGKNDKNDIVINNKPVLKFREFNG